jgi:hypothetical protein
MNNTTNIYNRVITGSTELIVAKGFPMFIN